MTFSHGLRHYFSEGHRRFVRMTAGTRIPNGMVRFPEMFSGARITGDESVKGYFQRIVSTELEGRIGPCRIEKDMGCFAVIEYKNDFINKLEIQIIKTIGDLKDYYEKDEVLGTYFRLDYCLDRLGNVFTHPHPHIHVQTKGSPRFWLNTHRGCIIADFFAFLYRNLYFDDLWIEWAERVYSSTIRSQADDVFDILVSLFQKGDYNTLVNRYRSHLEQFKNAGLEWRERITPKTINSDAHRLLTWDDNP